MHAHFASLSSILSSAAGCLALLAGAVSAAETVGLQNPGAADAWRFDQPTGSVQKGELVLDGRRRISRAFYLPSEFEDVAVSAQFLVEPQDQGVQACGFVVRAVDGRNYIYVHFDRGQAILVRYSDANEWNEIKRVSGLNKPAG
ncbi:MAG: hypothetical protein JNG89_21680, partial [Planctomycetaceae bacterium]|nr:hypothetical protein [Planctomycetaceae bacterium]